MKEHPLFRLELEQILLTYPNKHLLTITDVAAYVGRSRAYVRDKMHISGEISAVALAHRLTEYGGHK